MFKLVFGNHWNFGIVVADTLMMIKNALNELGYKADISKEPCCKSINILLENFDAEYLEKIKQVSLEGGRFWIVATEELCDDTFNLTARKGAAGTQYDKTEYWDTRYAAFVEALKYTELLFHPNQTQVPLYQALFPKAFFLPHGYTPNFATVRQKAASEKDLDFVFTGAVTDYRRQHLNVLRDKGYSVEVLPVLSASFYRDDVVSRAKICLNIRQSEEWPHFSNSRANYHICNESMLVSEYCPIHCDVANYISMPKQNFLDTAISLLESGEWETQAAENLNRYKKEQNLHILLKEILQQAEVFIG